MSLALTAWQAGYTEDRAYDVVVASPAGAPLAQRAASRGERSARTWWHRPWTKAEARVAQSPATRPPGAAARTATVQPRTHLLDRVAASAAARPRGPGRGDASVRRCLAAVIALAYDHGGSTRLIASHEQLSIASGLSRKTVWRSAAPALVAEGWLRVDRTGEGTHATRWELRVPEGAPAGDLTVPTSTSTSPTCSPGGSPRTCGDSLVVGIGDPIWHVWGRMGMPGCEIYAHLGAAPAPEADIVGATDVPPRTARRVLRRLADLGLAVRHPDGTWTRGDADPVAVAADLGLDVLMRNRRSRYAEQREKWRAAWPAIAARRRQRENARYLARMAADAPRLLTLVDSAEPDGPYLDTTTGELWWPPAEAEAA